MTMTLKATSAALVIGALAMSAPAMAQKKDKNAPPVAAPVANKAQVFATAGLDEAAAATNAFRTAGDQIKVSYKAQIDARDSRGRVLQAELQSMKIALEEASKKPGASEKTLQPQIQAFQEKQASAEREINQLSQQINLAVAYVREQISMSEDVAVRNAMRKRGVDVLINPEVIIFATNPAVDITRSIVDEYNLVVGPVQIIPPAGYQPGQLLQARAQQQAAAAPAPAQTGPAPAVAPDGR
jgi:Skp family chaperone for outer membrane proteins